MRALLLILAGLAASALLAACQPVRQPPELMVTPAKSEDQAAIYWAGDTPVVDLYSPSGIGAAQITWHGALEAEALLLRLHLAGFEDFQVTDGAQQAALSVDNTPPYTVRAEGGAQDIDVQRGDGFYEVRLGPTWLQSGGLAVQWVDFYR